jgi:hypothetical protein
MFGRAADFEIGDIAGLETCAYQGSHVQLLKYMSPIAAITEGGYKGSLRRGAFRGTPIQMELFGGRYESDRAAVDQETIFA